MSGNCNNDPNCSCTKTKELDKILKETNELVEEFKKEDQMEFPKLSNYINKNYKLDGDVFGGEYKIDLEKFKTLLKENNEQKELPEPTILYGMDESQEDDHCLVGFMIDEENERIKNQKGIRKFDTGATRDTDINKLGYSGFLSPIVLKAFAEYMNKNRIMADGSIRQPDNWQKLFGEHHEDVCMDSLLRHTMDVWLINRDFSKESREDIKTALCAIMFNAQAYLFKILKDEYDNRKD